MVSGQLKIGLVFAAIFSILVMGVGAASPALAQSTGRSASVDNGGYRLGTGDKLHINIFGQTDLNGDYVVDANGQVQFPLLGQLRAAGRTVSEFQQELVEKLSQGYFVNPSVSIDVVTYRPFYIIGEVGKPGEYPYVSGMSILNAVALAGGFTARADESDAYIRRNGSTKEVEVPADETTRVQPGDIIRIPERFF